MNYSPEQLSENAKKQFEEDIQQINESVDMLLNFERSIKDYDSVNSCYERLQDIIQDIKNSKFISRGNLIGAETNTVFLEGHINRLCITIPRFGIVNVPSNATKNIEKICKKFEHLRQSPKKNSLFSYFFCSFDQ